MYMQSYSQTFAKNKRRSIIVISIVLVIFLLISIGLLLWLPAPKWLIIVFGISFCGLIFEVHTYILTKPDPNRVTADEVMLHGDEGLGDFNTEMAWAKIMDKKNNAHMNRYQWRWRLIIPFVLWVSSGLALYILSI